MAVKKTCWKRAWTGFPGGKVVGYPGTGFVWENTLRNRKRSEKRYGNRNDIQTCGGIEKSFRYPQGRSETGFVLW
jgi:hypothetical protein